jgi:histidinol-phosphate/aromatic aminotransferase/cobyric acid decarboxylase-like protein
VRDFTVSPRCGSRLRSADSQTNFIFANIGKTMTAAAFRDACAAKGILVGRDFPPLEKTWARISLGTMEEMQKATDVFRSVLKPSTTTSSGKGQ